MKFFLRDAAIFAVLAAGASAAGSGLFAASGVELEAYKRSDGGLTYGEPARGLEQRDTAACTECVGHHGKCTIGEGNCYAPDSCGFCGDCGADQARCQDPKTEGCQCY
ncbi:unnamed protein product [Penicillium salamii]|uniref:Uncharacterized protein n=1 Tax=Penicillium salamii TaxID=1612424 RepID=A0A9W4NXE5_9EURO|nr:unnamed protein product [Penicillium salamii]CAG7946357.1 unnamed protein product [Penicillium salamii]CAG7950195.1 unnamed protein product [Penicillium salamii]CAG8013223.1 unnamed protein product [Penicillium salamii]CAG8241837.1 unnamed protein product [Penicillium salamii]